VKQQQQVGGRVKQLAWGVATCGDQLSDVWTVLSVSLIYLAHWSCLWATCHRQNGVCDAASELQALCCAWLPDVLGLLAIGQQTDCSVGQAGLDGNLQQYCYSEWGTGLSP
jgi:hypothetical protein